MERYRIYRRDNYIELVSENGSYIFKGFVKDVKVIPEVSGKLKYRFYGLSGWSPCIYLKLPQILDENGDRYTLSDWEDFYNQNTGNFSLGGGTPFDPSLYDLTDFQNGSLDRFIQESDLLAYSAVTSVANYSALPDPTTVPGEMYIAENGQGTQWLWGSLGGTYYPEGVYYSNGVKWVYQKSAYQATQMEVDAGLNTDKFVTPSTLSESTYVKDFTWTLDFTDGTLTVILFAPKEFKINSISNINNSPITLIEVNSSPYTLGDTINIGDEIAVTVDTASVINLNNTLA